jgi:hypothetical protein
MPTKSLNHALLTVGVFEEMRARLGFASKITVRKLGLIYSSASAITVNARANGPKPPFAENTSNDGIQTKIGPPDRIRVRPKATHARPPRAIHRGRGIGFWPIRGYQLLGSC